MTTVLNAPNIGGNPLLLDKPEQNLHPRAITLLGAMIRSAATSDRQIVVATQSPTLLDEFRPEEVIVAGRVGDATRYTRLDAKRLNTWLTDYSLGELWLKNEIGGR